jgi:hypothetical protein
MVFENCIEENTIFGGRREEVKGEWGKAHKYRFITFTPHHILIV